MDTATRQRLDRHLVGAYTLFYRTIPKGLFEIMPNWVRGLSHVQIPNFNIFMPLNQHGLNDDVLADTAAFFSSHNALYAVELIHDRLPHGPAYLAQQRYQPLPPQPAMYLPSLPQNLRLQSRLTVHQVKTVPMYTAFYSILHDVFDYPFSDINKLFPVTHLDKTLTPFIRHYIGFVDDQPVTAATLICRDGIATVRDICTIDAYRRQGMAQSLLYHILSDVAKEEYTISRVYSTAQAYHLFLHFGFEIYTQRQWFLPPDLQYD